MGAALLPCWPAGVTFRLGFKTLKMVVEQVHELACFTTVVLVLNSGSTSRFRVKAVRHSDMKTEAGSSLIQAAASHDRGANGCMTCKTLQRTAILDTCRHAKSMRVMSLMMVAPLCMALCRELAWFALCRLQLLILTPSSAAANCTSCSLPPPYSVPAVWGARESSDPAANCKPTHAGKDGAPRGRTDGTNT